MAGWRDEVTRIDRVHMKPLHLLALRNIEEWWLTAYSTNIAAYQNRSKELLDAFGDLYLSDLLNVHRHSVTGTSSSASFVGGGGEEENNSINDNGGTGGDGGGTAGSIIVSEGKSNE